MAWKIKGKIGYHFPDRTGLNSNFDVARIVYSQDGIEANAKEIEKVYYISPAAVTAIAAQTTQEARMAELAKWIVWQKYCEDVPVVRQLVQGSDYYVMQKYEPGSTDVTATTISIFTTRNATNNRCLFILDDNGFLVGKSTDESIVSMELHGLEGYKRTMTFSPSFTFKAGKTYWLQYYYDGNSSAPDSYYENEQGLDYKNLSCNGHQSDTPVDMSSANYIGELFQSNTQMADIVATILELNQGDVFRPRRSSEYPISGMNINYFYERNNNYLNKTVTQVDHSTLTSDKNKPRNSELAGMSAGDLLVIGYDDNSGNGMVFVWERTNVILPDTITDYSISTKAEIADWMVAANVAGNGNTFSNSYWTWPYTAPAIDGSVYIRTNQGSVEFSSSSDALDAPPASPIIGALYLKAEGAVFPGVESWQGDMIVFYDGNQWNMFSSDNGSIDNEYTMADGITKIKYFDKLNFSSITTDITSSVFPGIITQLNPQPTIIDISSQTLNDKRHYLEIDGREVF